MTFNGFAMEIIDTHVHLWDPFKTPREVSFLTRLLGSHPKLLDKVANVIFPKNAREFFGSPEYITRPYLPPDYSADAAANEVRGIVHVEAGWKGKGPFGCVDETKWLASINSSSSVQPKILAIIANARLADWENVDAVLKAHLAASELVKGVRETLAWQPDKKILNGASGPDLINSTNWRKGFDIFSRSNLVFEATIYHRQMSDLARLAETYPDVPMVVSHLATPVAVAGEFGDNGKTVSGRRDTFNDWQEGLSALAGHRKVHVKLSGLAMPICGFGWHLGHTRPSAQEIADSLAPYIHHAIAAFGAERCLFGSNFPIDKVSLSLDRLIDAYRIILNELTDDQRHNVFYSNAISLYKIRPEQTG